MATKFVIALACFALCHASPVLLKSYIFRSGRGYSIGQGYTNNAGGRATGSATSNRGVHQAYGTATSDGYLGRNAYGVPGETVAKAEVYDGPGALSQGVSKAVAEAQHAPTFYAVPAPATIISYEQNFDHPGTVAQSSGIINGQESSVTSAQSQGSGSAESSAKTQGIGTYGITSSNAKTLGSGYGTATSNVNNGYGTANTAARTHGYGSANSKSETGSGLTSAATKTSGGYASSSANNNLNAAVVSATSQGTASSTADVNAVNVDVANPVFKTSNLKGWRFGTAYTVPAPGVAQVFSQANGGTVKSYAHTDGVLTTADTQGYGSASSNAKLPGGYVNSAANSNGLGYGAARQSDNGFGSSQSTINNGLGNIKSLANSNGNGNANSFANVNDHGTLLSVSNSNGLGTAASSANSAQTYGVRGLPYVISPVSNVNTQTSGHGSASARTQGLDSGYRVVNSSANSFGNGAAQANARA